MKSVVIERVLFPDVITTPKKVLSIHNLSHLELLR